MNDKSLPTKTDITGLPNTTDSSYKSKENNLSLINKLSIINSLTFFIRFFKIILKCGKDSKLGLYDAAEWSASSYRIFQALEAAGANFEITGLDILSKTRDPVVIIGNHMSILETVILPSVVVPRKKQLIFVLKKQLAEMPVFNHVVKATNAIAVGRTSPIDDYKLIMRKGDEMIKKGYSILIFPQTTRSAKFMPEEFNSVGVKLAKRSGVPIVPLALKTDFWSAGKFAKDIALLKPKNKIYLKFGEPISVTSRNGKEEQQQVIDFIQNNMDIWK